jgi:sulfate adenylyltransferase (ADP) / ATP adenylyltransferase
MTSSEQVKQSELLVPGMLWDKVVGQTKHAIACGALQPICTTDERLEQTGLNFIVRVSNHIARKEAAGKKSQQKSNPFLPYEQDLFVADLSSTHVALLNKFNVVDHHLLMITRHFELQESWLTLADFIALAICIAEINALAFYNGGKAAGASQRHKHLQLVPLPLIEGDVFSSPFETVTTASLLAKGKLELPFLHAVAPLSLDWTTAPQVVATELNKHYHSLYDALGLQMGGQPQPYNLLVTRHWMFLVPRSQESYAGISVNALGFAGSLFVQDLDQFNRLKQIGPMSLLQKVACPT